VDFGSGRGCAGLTEVATRDLFAGTTRHTVVVSGNDLPGTVGDNGIVPGVTYWFEAVTVTRSGVEVDDNGGKCFEETVWPVWQRGAWRANAIRPYKGAVTWRNNGDGC
jgi:hypothetical protein